MNLYEEFALGLYLSAWPDNVPYNDIMAALDHEDNHTIYDSICPMCAILEDIDIWEPLEYHDNPWIAENIDNARESLEKKFIIRGT